MSAKKIEQKPSPEDRAVSRFSSYWGSLDPDQAGLARFVTIAVEKVGGRGKACEIMGVSPVTLDNYRQGRTQPKALELMKLLAAEAGRISAESDVAIEPIARQLQELKKSSLPSLEGLGDGVVKIPRFDIQASAGSGQLVAAEEADGYFAVDRQWLSRYVSRSATVGVIEASGDSMSPTIRNRDLLLVEVREGATAEEIMRGGIYVLTLDGGLVVKRLQLDRDTLLVLSDNAAYPPIRVGADEVADRVHIHGIVFWTGGALETHR